jgi:hypothetical protein
MKLLAVVLMLFCTAASAADWVEALPGRVFIDLDSGVVSQDQSRFIATISVDTVDLRVVMFADDCAVGQGFVYITNSDYVLQHQQIYYRRQGLLYTDLGDTVCLMGNLLIRKQQ